MATRQEVERFLEEFRLAAELFGLRYLRSDQAEQWAMDLGLSGLSAVKPFITALTADDYVSGPDQDHHSQEHQVWVFGCEVDGVEVYVKLRLMLNPKSGSHHAAVWSFHSAEHPLVYPLRGGGQ